MLSKAIILKFESRLGLRVFITGAPCQKECPRSFQLSSDGMLGIGIILGGLSYSNEK